MAKWILVFLTALLPISLVALPTSNPGEASFCYDSLFLRDCLSNCGNFSLRGGFYGDYVFNRHTQVDSSISSGDIDKTTIYTNGGIVTLNFCNLLDVYAILAETKIALMTPEAIFTGRSISNVNTVLQTESDFSWGVGGRLSWSFCGGSLVGVDGRYFSANLPISYIKRENVSPRYLEDVSLKYQEWQLSAGYSHRFCSSDGALSFAPYLALKWAGLRGNMDEAVLPITSFTFPYVLHDLVESKCIGYVVGITSLYYQKASINVEGRFADELALHINAQLVF